MAGANEKTAPNLITDVLAHVSSLVRKEVDLARAEVNESAQRAGTALGMIVAAIAEMGIDAGLAALGVGLLLALIGAALAARGVNDLKTNNLAPTRATANVKKDAQTLKENIYA